MDTSRFELFKDQQKRFKEALRKYDSNIWFPPLRGKFEENVPSNWFMPFIPAAWGHWKGAVYGVHFDFMYGRPCGSKLERIRLVIGVEKPVQVSQRQAFKEDVISRVKAEGTTPSGFKLQAHPRTKLMEADHIPFNNQSWHITFEHYKTLKPLVETIAKVLRDYYDRNRDAFVDREVDFSC